MMDRFWAKVDQRGSDECWPWLGSTKSGGTSRAYGMFWDAGRVRPAHVVAWELANGQPFPAGMDGCHHCDTPSCVNPAHIFPGTARDNAQDAAHKGRVSNQNKIKVLCQNAHPLSGDNLYVTPRGYRRCRICTEDRRRFRRSQRRAA